MRRWGSWAPGPRWAWFNRRELRAADDPDAERDRLADAYAAEHLGAEAAATEGFVDEIIEPFRDPGPARMGAALLRRRGR